MTYAFAHSFVNPENLSNAANAWNNFRCCLLQGPETGDFRDTSGSRDPRDVTGHCERHLTWPSTCNPGPSDQITGNG